MSSDLLIRDKKVPKDCKQYSPIILTCIKNCINKNINILDYIDESFKYMQVFSIRRGLEQGLDVSIYADSRFDFNQMEEIRDGLFHNLDVRLYAKPEYNYIKMRRIKNKMIRLVQLE